MTVSRNRSRLIDSLLKSAEPSIRWKILVQVVGEDPESRKARTLREEIRTSPRVRALLVNRDRKGRLEPRNNVYSKWQGAHWTLVALARLGYPPGDKSLGPIRDQVLNHWLSTTFYEEFEVSARSARFAGSRRTGALPDWNFPMDSRLPPRRALDRAGIATLAQLARRKESEVLELHGMGPNALATLRTALKSKGLSFRR